MDFTLPFDGHSDEFSAKYWLIFDTDNSGTLNFEESMFFIAAINDGFAGLVIKVRKLRYSSVLYFSLQGFDENGNGILDGQETIKFKEEIHFDFETERDAWTDSQMDGDNNTCTKAELVQFFLRSEP